MIARDEGAPNEAAGTDVEILRAEIEAVDDAIIDLLARRVELGRALGTRKRALGRPTLDPAREAEVVTRAAAGARRHGLDEEEIRAIFWSVVDLCRSAQLPSTTEVGAESEGR